MLVMKRDLVGEGTSASCAIFVDVSFCTLAMYVLISPQPIFVVLISFQPMLMMKRDLVWQETRASCVYNSTLEPTHQQHFKQSMYISYCYPT